MRDMIELQKRCAEVIGAWEEHRTMMLVGGHSPERVEKAMAHLKTELALTLRPDLRIVSN